MDHFAAFGEKPRPWLEAHALKEKYFALSAEAHPDKARANSGAEGQFSGLNQSYHTLRQTRTRLLHFLELQGLPGAAHVQTVPEAVVDFFTPIAELTRGADELVKQRNAAASPMLKVRFFEQALAATEKIQDLQTRLAEKIRRIEAEVQELDGRWLASADPAIIPRVQAAAAELGFLERWSAQLQQRLAALAF